MRAAGCAINDFADRKVDGQVKRTHARPFGRRPVITKNGSIHFIGLSLLAACFAVFYPNQFFIGLWVRYYWHLFIRL